MSINKSHRIEALDKALEVIKNNPSRGIDIVSTSLKKGALDQTSHSGLGLSLSENFHLDLVKAGFLFGLSTKQLINKIYTRVKNVWSLKFPDAFAREAIFSYLQLL